MKIQKIVMNDEPRRLFYLVAEVTFADREAAPRDEDDYNYYQDSELRDITIEWMSDGLHDRDDSPAISFHGLGNSPLSRNIWEWIISANNGHGADVGDLISIMDNHGAPCPEDLEDDE